MRPDQLRTRAERWAYLYGVLAATSGVIAAFGETPGEDRLTLLSAIDDKHKALLAEIEAANE